MGYSCAALASYTMDALGDILRGEDVPGEPRRCGNGIYRDGKHIGFYERGRENDDGAITGTVFRYVGDGHCRRVGSYRVDPDGNAVRFPLATAEERRDASAKGKARYAELHAPYLLI